MREAQQLPGGLPECGEAARRFAFRPLDGALELALAEAAHAENLPLAVTGMLACALSSLAGAEPQPARVDALCVADRQFLMRALERHLGAGARWFSAACVACAARFDLQIDPVALPMQPAGTGFPLARVARGGHEYVARVPTGADQIWIAGLPAGEARETLPRRLAARLIVAVDAGPVAVPVAALDDELVDALDAALDAVAPALATRVLADCPECGHRNTVAFDPYGALARGADELLDDVHRIAAHYHWSERDILALPRGRRLRYLQRIDAQRALSG